MLGLGLECESLYCILDVIYGYAIFLTLTDLLSFTCLHCVESSTGQRENMAQNVGITGCYRASSQEARLSILNQTYFMSFISP